MFERVGVMKANMLTIMFECWEKILGEFYILPNVNVKCFHSGLQNEFSNYVLYEIKMSLDSNSAGQLHIGGILLVKTVVNT